MALPPSEPDSSPLCNPLYLGHIVSMNAFLSSHEPATGAQVWQGEVSDIDGELARVRSAWPHWAAQPVAFRVETVRRFANGLRAAEEQLAPLIAREIGKPLWEARAELDQSAAAVERSIAAFSERAGTRRLEGAMGGRNALRHKPHGALGVITPFCNPLSIPCGHIVPALLGGNGVAFKPSEKAPGVGTMLVGLLHGAGVPADLVRLIIGGPEQGKALVLHPLLDGLLFTGSTRVGMALHSALASSPERIVALHMGGNNPLVVWDTPDLPTAATLVVQSAFAAAGQSCTAARRLIVRDTLADPLLTEIRKLLDRLIIDDPLADPAPFMGPVIDLRTADGLTESFLTLSGKNGRPLRHMARPHGDLPFVTPGIIDMTQASERPDVELFGPLLQLVRVADFDGAIREANATRFGLCAALLGGSPEQFDQFWASIRAGVINWNRPTHAVAPGAPLGGLGASGNHRPGGGYAPDTMTYPVASAEEQQMRGVIGIGLKAVDTAAMGD